MTCVGGQYVYDIICALRSADDFTVTVIGVDADPASKGSWLADHFEIIPMAKSNEELYCHELARICEKHRVDILILGSEAETRAVAWYPSVFTQLGIKTTADNIHAVHLLTDKFTMLDFLKKKGIEVGAYVPVDSIADAEQALDTLGYSSSHPVIFKPRQGTGSRGVLIADNTLSEFTYLLPNRFCGRGPIEAIVREMENQGEIFDNCLAMPYYGDQAYDVDCVAIQGKAVHVIPRLRQYTNPLSPVNEGCKVIMEHDLISYISEIIEVFGINGVCDFDVTRDNQGVPKILDASSRMSGSVGATFTAGVNIPAQLVRILSDLPLKRYDIQNGVELRSVHHFVTI